MEATATGYHHSPFSLLPSKFELTALSAEILEKMSKLRSQGFKNDAELIKDIQKIKAVDLSNTLKCFMALIIEKGQFEYAKKDLERIVTVISLEKLQEVCKIKNVRKEVKKLFEDAKFYLTIGKRETSPSLQHNLSAIVAAIILLIENLILAVGLAGFFKSSDNEAIAYAKTNRITVLLNIFTLMTTMLIPLVGVQRTVFIVGGSLLGLTLLSAIWPLIKPMPTQLPANAENWSKEILKVKLVVEGRKESLDEIASVLKMNRHAILVGPSRVGKSLTAKAFAQAIQRGDYPEFKGIRVFRINTADLVDQKASYFGGGDSVLNEISLAMGRHRNNILLVLDEIHMACKKNEKIADQLKLFLDEGGNFPHVIAITTQNEYESHIENNIPFFLRFDKIDIKNTCEEETLRILYDTLLSSTSRPLVNEGVLEYIYAKSQEKPNAPQPISALKILKKCINVTRTSQKSLTEKNVIKISNQMLLFRSKSVTSRSTLKDLKPRFKKLEKERKDLTKKAEEEEKDRKKLFDAKIFLEEMTTEFYHLIMNLNQNESSFKNVDKLKFFLLLRELLPVLEDYIKNKASQLGVKLIIDQALVDEIAK